MDDGTEALIEVRADLAVLARIAWTLGDRHVAVQILADRIRLRSIPALEALVRSLGGEVATIMARFDPEGGAYQHRHSAGGQRLHAASPDGHHHDRD